MPARGARAANRQNDTAAAERAALGIRRELEDLGLSPYEARVLLALLRLGSATSAELAQASGVPRTSAYQVLEELGRKRLVEQVPGGRAAVWACPGVDLVFDRLDAAQEERLREHRTVTARLRKELAQPAPPTAAVTPPFVHLMRGATEVRAVYDRLLAGARDEVLVFNRPPYSTTDAETRLTPDDRTGQDEVNPIVLAALRRGVRFRVLYVASHWEAPDAEPFRAAMATYHRAGVEGRLVDELPLKLAVADRAAVLTALPDPVQEIGYPTNLFIDHAGFAALQADGFDHRWTSARPME
ncbi:MAG TPA: helix-turn-helix domain-containing protein [Acidimicrobiales bacterium]|nr:helix-turn-helix domain-containing protein [Acidimicrobiales bacterium]